MELLWYVAGGIVVFVGSSIGGFVAGFIFNEFAYYGLDRRIFSLENKAKSSLGVQAREEKSVRMGEAIARAVALKAEGKEAKEIVQTVALEYPDLAMDIAGKLLKGKLGGLGGLI